MKQLLYILFAVTLFTACSSDDDPIIPPEPTQDHTSFTVACETESQLVKNCIVGYKGSDGKWIRVAALGDIKGKTESKEVTVDYNKVKEVYIFEDEYKNNVYTASYKTQASFKFSENKKIKIVLPYSYSVDKINKDDPNQYPQE